MTFEEITQTLQTVAENQAQTSADIRALREQTEKLAGAGNILEEAAALHQQVLRNHEERMAKLEETRAMLVEMIGRHEDRLDGHDSDHERTDGRLDALIDDQISARSQAEERGRLLDEKLARLSLAQARADEQIRMLTDRNGDTKR